LALFARVRQSSRDIHLIDTPTDTGLQRYQFEAFPLRRNATRFATNNNSVIVFIDATHALK
jgi:hypothetical protein